MTKDEYEERMRRLAADAEDARKTLARAQQNFDVICEDMATLRFQWGLEQRQAACTCGNKTARFRWQHTDACPAKVASRGE